MPLALLPYSILLDLVARLHTNYSVVLILAGIVPLVALAVGSARRMPSGSPKR